MKKKSQLKPSKEMQKAFDLFPKVVKKKEQVAREKKRIRKNFESLREQIFGKKNDLD